MSASFLDTVYGESVFGPEITSLVATPVVQRLRHIRLSNIDSLDMPGIANLSRYEHVLGVSHLASKLGIYSRLPRDDRAAISAAALLHDWAVTSFGHLVEEAFRYVGTGFDHENRLYEILVENDQEEIGGIERQILYGRQTKLREWATKIVGATRREPFLREINDYIQGSGQYGRLISGDIDLDNIDGVFRMAVHMGLAADRESPVRLAEAIVDTSGPNGRPVFRRSAAADINRWVSLRKTVYRRLMLANSDFAGKLMILYAAVTSLESGELTKSDWSLIDQEFLSRLVHSREKAVRDTATRWLAGEVWNTTPLYWMAGPCPDYSSVLRYSKKLSLELSRHCFAYAIRDKRNRLLEIAFEDGTSETFGEDSSQWLLGVGSPVRRRFTAAETKQVIDMAESHFASRLRSSAMEPSTTEDDGGNQGWLL